MKLNEALAKMNASQDDAAARGMVAVIRRKGRSWCVRTAKDSEHLSGHRYVRDDAGTVVAFDATVKDLAAEDWELGTIKLREDAGASDPARGAMAAAGKRLSEALEAERARNDALTAELEATRAELAETRAQLEAFKETGKEAPKDGAGEKSG